MMSLAVWIDRSRVSSHLQKLSAILCTLLLTAGCAEPQVQEQDPVRPLRVMRVGDLAEFSGRSFPGRAAAYQEVNLSFRVGGPLITFPAKVGDKVATGDVLARIDPRDFEVNLLNVQGELERAQADFVLAEREYQRAVEAEKKNADLISESELDRRLGARDRSRANVNALQAALQSATDELSYTHLIAPFSGTVVSNYVENFEDVGLKQPVLRLLDTTRLEFTINIPETLISMLDSVTGIRVTFDAFPDISVPADIEEIGSEASESTRTYPVTLIMDQPEGEIILPGMAGKAIGLSNQSNVDSQRVVIPVTAVFSDQSEGASNVWVLDEAAMTVSRREVQVGRLIAAGIEIESGLDNGETIAIAGTHFLAEGQQVRPAFD
jgi:RND family efflux transporter MFP subunit